MGLVMFGVWIALTLCLISGFERQKNKHNISILRALVLQQDSLGCAPLVWAEKRLSLGSPKRPESFAFAAKQAKHGSRMEG